MTAICGAAVVDWQYTCEPFCWRRQ